MTKTFATKILSVLLSVCFAFSFMGVLTPAEAGQPRLLPDFATTAETSTSDEQFWPVSLKCPAENGGTLDLTSENRHGRSQRLRVTFAQSGIATSVRFSVGDATNGFSDIVNEGALADQQDRARKRNALRVAGRAINLLRFACRAEKNTREAYEKVMATNRARLPADKAR